MDDRLFSPTKSLSAKSRRRVPSVWDTLVLLILETVPARHPHDGAGKGNANMDDARPKMRFSVHARRVDAHGSEAQCKAATLRLDTDLQGRTDAFNPAELLLAALAACMLKGIERVTPALKFDLRGVEIHIEGVRQDVPPRLESVRYEILVDTDEEDHRLALLHKNVMKYGTVYNTVAPGTDLSGTMRRSNALPAHGK